MFSFNFFYLSPTKVDVISRPLPDNADQNYLNKFQKM